MTDPIITENEQQKPRRCRKRLMGILILTLVFLAIMAGIGFGYLQLAQVNLSIARTLSHLQKQTTAHQASITALQQSIEELRQAAQKTEALSAQQENILAEWRAAQKGDLSKWRMAEAQYLVRLANDSLQYEYNSVLAIILLKRAQDILQSLQDPALLDMQKSLAADIAGVEASQPVNATALYLELTGLKAQIDALSLPVNPLDKNNPPAENVTLKPGLLWWQAGWERTLQALSKIVIVRYNGSNALPLMLPEEKTFLYQNLHAQMESAMWAVLHRNADIYQASLAREKAWIEKYFVQDAATTAVLQKLQELAAINIQPPAINLSATLQLFDNYFTQAGQVSKVQ